MRRNCECWTSLLYRQGERGHASKIDPRSEQDWTARAEAAELRASKAEERDDWPAELHQETRALVTSFARALAHKLRRAEEKYGYSDGWRTEDWADECRNQLAIHVRKGDPLDVAAYAAFCWARQWRTSDAWPEPIEARDCEAEHRRTEAELSDVEALIARLKSNAPLPVCPFDRRSPDYYTAGENGAACTVCGGTEEVDRCRGADTRIMEEAAAALQASEAARLKAEGERDAKARFADGWREKFHAVRKLNEAAELRASKAEEREAKLLADKARLDWLEFRTVEVRDPLVHGSRHLFFANPDDSFEGEEGPSDLRAKIDAALNQVGGADAQP
jgi:hypothetical protein